MIFYTFRIIDIFLFVYTFKIFKLQVVSSYWMLELWLTDICSYSMSTHNSRESYSDNTLPREATVSNTVKTIYALKASLFEF